MTRQHAIFREYIIITMPTSDASPQHNRLSNEIISQVYANEMIIEILEYHTRII